MRLYVEEEKLLELLGQAFDEGHGGYAELKEGFLQRILNDLKKDLCNPSKNILINSNSNYWPAIHSSIPLDHTLPLNDDGFLRHGHISDPNFYGASFAYNGEFPLRAH